MDWDGVLWRVGCALAVLALWLTVLFLVLCVLPELMSLYDRLKARLKP